MPIASRSTCAFSGTIGTLSNRAGSGGADGFSCGGKRGDILGAEPPAGQPVGPLACLAFGGRSRARVHPGRELGGREVRKIEQQVSDIPLWVDRQDRNPLLEQLLHENDAKGGLAAPRHSDDQSVRRQVVGIEQKRLGALGARRGVHGASHEQGRGHRFTDASRKKFIPLSITPRIHVLTR